MIFAKSSVEFGMCSPLQKDKPKMREHFGMNSAWRKSKNLVEWVETKKKLNLTIKSSSNLVSVTFILSQK